MYNYSDINISYENYMSYVTRENIATYVRLYVHKALNIPNIDIFINVC